MPIDRDALARELRAKWLQECDPWPFIADIAMRHIAAARAEALEDCIKAVEQHGDCDKYNRALVDVIEAISALMEPPA